MTSGEPKKKYRKPRGNPKKFGRESKLQSTRREEIGKKVFEAEKREKMNPLKAVMTRLIIARKKREQKRNQ